MNEELNKNLKVSETFETEIYFEMAQKLYGTCASQCEELYHIAIRTTEEFKNVTPEAILEDSRIIKILRYCMLPCQSQMKFGQLLGLSSTSKFEDVKVKPGTVSYRELQKVAIAVCDLFQEYMDKQRFLWLNVQLNKPQKQLALTYAKNWTCSLIANQNSTTEFRNWRKELQENTAVKQLLEAGYTQVEKRQKISQVEDLLPGQFSRECVVEGINPQKADFVVRLKKSKKLLLIEAKAIGVKLDSHKRLKECREKFEDWRQSFGRKGCETAAFLSGFLTEKGCESLLELGSLIFWEHNKSLYDYVAEE
ncbi:MAG: XamI family restriction endonuclease [Bacteroidales bacterium]|nr:XamI family restriction endonuclease [Bacteroidales bacterium]